MSDKPVWRLDIGEKAPGFSLLATGDGAGRGGDMRQITLKEYRGRKHVVLAFYPAAFTSV
jgi:peroxiredoxin